MDEKLDISDEVLTNDWLNPADPIAAYRHNPLIGALGPVPTHDQVTELLTQRPPYDPSERRLPNHLRPHAVCALRRLFIPTRTHEAVVNEFELLLRQGYVHRNPLSPRYRKWIHKDRPLLKRGVLPPERFSRTTLLGTAAMGTAGTGKTVAFDISASRHPQVLDHCYDFEGTRIAFKQVVWLKLNLFHDASLKAFGVEFFERLGEAIGRSLRREWGVDRCNGNSIQPLIYLASREYNLGFLVIDEVQNMASLGASYHLVLNYFIRMMNCLGLPIAIIGTNVASALVRSDLAVARRFLGSIPPFRPFRKDEPLWREFLREVWRLEYVRCPSNPDDFKDLVHELTGGVPDLVVKLYALAQSRLFGREREIMTVRVLKETAQELFSVVNDRLSQLRGESPETPGIEKARERSDQQFRKAINSECGRVGAAPAFPEELGELPAEIHVGASVSAGKRKPSTSKAIVEAGKSDSPRAKLAKLGVLEFPQ